MSSFANRLKEEIEYLGLTRKELAFKADIKLRALAMYLGTQNSMPPADVAVRLARALNVTVEYLVTGEGKINRNENPPVKSKIETDLQKCSKSTQRFLETAVHLFAQDEENKKKSLQ